MQNTIHKVRELFARTLRRTANFLSPPRAIVSAYKDSTQFGVEANGTFKAEAWQGPVMPVVTGRIRMYESFQPKSAIAAELLIVTFRNAEGREEQVAVDVADAGDLKIISAFAGAKNCFPIAPDQATGVSCRALSSNGLGNGIWWPVVHGGTDLTVAFSVSPAALHRATPPAGFTSADIVSIDVKATLNMFGELLRSAPSVFP